MVRQRRAEPPPADTRARYEGSRDRTGLTGMRALTGSATEMYGWRRCRTQENREPGTDAVVRITSTAICGSDPHL